jgi:outer membrane protein OmpA-like peptidoglycan-associated protein
MSYLGSARARLAPGLMVLLLLVPACQTVDPATRTPKMSETSKGALKGAGVTGFECGVLAFLNGANAADIAKISTACALAGGILGAAEGSLADERDRQLLAEFQSAGLSVSVRENNLVLNSAEDIRFAEDSVMPENAAALRLGSVARIVDRFPQRAIEVVGHTSDGEADGLGMVRARNVKALLIRSGVAPGRIRVSNRSHSEPLVPDGASLSAYRNRRVEVFFVPAS